MQIVQQGTPQSEVWQRRPFMKMRRMEMFRYLQAHGITQWEGREIRPDWFKNDMVAIAEQLHGKPRPVPEVQEKKHALHDAVLKSSKQPTLRKILREAGIPTPKDIKKDQCIQLIKENREKIISHDAA